ncbi:MAG: hypothetical protein AAFN65_08120, partial [Bacteroidota bacterium]
MNYHLPLIILLFVFTKQGIKAQSANSNPYSVEELQEAYHFHPFSDINIVPLNKERLQAGTTNEDLLAIWSYLSLARRFGENNTQHLISAYDLGASLQIDNQLLSYICHEIALSYREKYMFSFARVYAGKGLALAEQGSYEWLLNWVHFSEGLSEDAFLVPLKEALSTGHRSISFEESIVILHLIGSRAHKLTWYNNVLNDLYREIHDAKPYFQLRYWMLILYSESAITDDINLPDLSPIEEFQSSYHDLFNNLSIEDKYQYEAALSMYFRLKAEYIESNQCRLRALEIKKLQFEDKEDLQFYESLSLNNNTEDYANTLLFLTREGMGLEPVIEAFDIYHKTYLSNLYLATKHINAFDFIQHNEKIINSNNLL